MIGGSHYARFFLASLNAERVIPSVGHMEDWPDIVTLLNLTTFVLLLLTYVPVSSKLVRLERMQSSKLVRWVLGRP